MDKGRSWSWLRSVLNQGADIWLDHQTKGNEQFNIRLDSAARERADELQAMLDAPPSAPLAARHTDDVAVDLFAESMQRKLARKRCEGRGGWDDPEQCRIDTLENLLDGHIEKAKRRPRVLQDLVDIANFCMMLWHRYPKDEAWVETQLARASAPLAKQQEGT